MVSRFSKVEVTGGFEKSSFRGVVRVPVMERDKRDRTRGDMQSFKNFCKKEKDRERSISQRESGVSKVILS